MINPSTGQPNYTKNSMVRQAKRGSDGSKEAIDGSNEVLTRKKRLPGSGLLLAACLVPTSPPPDPPATSPNSNEQFAPSSAPPLDDQLYQKPTSRVASPGKNGTELAAEQ